MAKIDAFETHTEAYDAWFERHADAYRAELEAVRRLLVDLGLSDGGAAEGVDGIEMVRPSVRAAEIGVGSGLFAQPLGIRLGVEPSPKMAARARARGLEVLDGTAEALPLPDASLDLALMVTTICFVDDPATAMTEAARVLAPGGVLVVAFVDAASELGRRYDRQRATSKFYGQATFFTGAQIVDLMAGAGLRFAGGTQTLLGDPPPHAVLPARRPRGSRAADDTGDVGDSSDKRGAFLVLAGRRSPHDAPKPTEPHRATGQIS